MNTADHDLAHQNSLEWTKSSFSGQQGCVEAALHRGGGIAVRDSKAPDKGYLVYTAMEWRAFLAGVRNGEFDYLADPRYEV